MTNTRKCNFCNQHGHTIIICDSPLIDEFQQKCFLKASGFNYNEAFYLIENEYLNWLREQPTKLIKVLALNLLLIKTSTKRIGIYINLISTHMLSNAKNRQILNDTYNCELHTMVRNFINSQEPHVQQQIMSFIYSQETNTIENSYQLVYDTFMCGRFNVPEISVFYEKINNLAIDYIHECNICYEHIPLNHMVTYNCKHSFCGSCTEIYIKGLSDTSVAICAMCRTYITNIKTHKLDILIHIQDAINNKDCV